MLVNMGAYEDRLPADSAQRAYRGTTWREMITQVRHA